MSSKSTKSLNTKKNTLSSVESGLQEIPFVVKGAGAVMPLVRLQYKTSVRRHNVNTHKVKIARGDRPV